MHSLEFLEKQFTSIGNINSNNFCASRLLSLSTLIASVFFGAIVGYGLKTTIFAYINGIEIRHFKESFS